ncbi:MAG TPA: MFS transporter [Bacteroidales bacterium]|nr:MFS transporter [Bacteroidales bacterium]HQG37294.1 MFS transporter [Bacteroidales bacterium]HQG52042.1 MFS transporter [Bacteroidales bacterium]HQJ21203.1 MFS transporter [Bacteroidales bacterium]HRC89416.1 MFS transporter [Bacteroidales bacterium]
MIICVASVIGPILGGALVHVGWRFIFYFNIPIGLIGTIWAVLQLKELNVLPEKQKFDWKGAIIFTSAMIALLLALTFGGFHGWTNIRVIVLFISAFLLLGSFLLIENRTDQPMLDLELFRTRILSFAYCSNLLNGIARGAVVFLLVFYFQGIKGIYPVTSGILLAPFALSMMIMAPISGRLSDRFGSRELSSIGLFISALGMLGMVRISADSSVGQQLAQKLNIFYADREIIREAAKQLSLLEEDLETRDEKISSF